MDIRIGGSKSLDEATKENSKPKLSSKQVLNQLEKVRSILESTPMVDSQKNALIDSARKINEAYVLHPKRFKFLPISQNNQEGKIRQLMYQIETFASVKTDPFVPLKLVEESEILLAQKLNYQGESYSDAQRYLNKVIEGWNSVVDCAAAKFPASQDFESNDGFRAVGTIRELFNVKKIHAENPSLNSSLNLCIQFAEEEILANESTHNKFLALVAMGAKFKNSTILNTAASAGNLRVIQILLDNDGDVNHKDPKGNTPLMNLADFPASLSERGRHERLEACKLIIAQKGVHIDEKNNAGKTALKIAEDQNNQELVTLILMHLLQA